MERCWAYLRSGLNPALLQDLGYNCICPGRLAVQCRVVLNSTVPLEERSAAFPLKWHEELIKFSTRKLQNANIGSAASGDHLSRRDT